MAKVAVYNQEGANVKEIELNDAVFGIEPNKQAMFDMVLLQRASIRQGTHKVKIVQKLLVVVKNHGDKKVLVEQDKVQFVHLNGVVEELYWLKKPRKYGFKINLKVGRLALRSALSCKVIDSELMVLDQIVMEAPKTKEMIRVLGNLRSSKKNFNCC